MKKQNLLFLTHVGNPGGAELNMVDYCTSNSYQSSVLQFQHGSLETLLEDKGIASSVLPMPDKMKNFTKDDGIMGVFRAILPTLSMVKNLAKKGKQYDAIVCMSQKSFILASLAKPFTRKPIIWFMNDILSKNYFNPILISILKFISRLSANHVVLNSQASLTAWKESGAKSSNVTVIHPGIDLDRFDQALKNEQEIKQLKTKFSADNKPLIGIFGRITDWKGQDVFMKAIAQIKDVNAIIVGDALFGEEEYKNSLLELTKSLSVQDRVKFTGHIDNVPAAMAACDIIAHCSTIPEPFGLVIAEATTVKTPVIATDAGGAKEIIAHNQTGQLAPMGDVDALVTAIKRYLKDPKWANELANNARKNTEECFSKNAMIGKFEKILEEIRST